MNFDQVFFDYRGRPVMYPDAPEQRNGAGHVTATAVSHQTTLADVAAEALMNGGTPTDTTRQKLAAHDLALRCFKGGEIEVSDEDIALLKEKIGAQYNPSIVGPAHAMLSAPEKYIKAVGD